MLYLQLCHQVIVSLGILALQVLHEAAAFSDFLDEASAGREVFLVSAQVLREIADLFGQYGDLDLG